MPTAFPKGPICYPCMCEQWNEDKMTHYLSHVVLPQQVL